MASILDAKLGLWQDYSRPFLDQRQLLESDLLLKWMIAFVTSSLVVISPCIFKILRSLLIFILRHLSHVDREWRSIRRSQGPRLQDGDSEQDPLHPVLEASYQTSEPDDNAVQPANPTDSSISRHTRSNGAIQGDNDQSITHQGSSATSCPECGGETRLSAVDGNIELAERLMRSEDSRGFVFKVIKEAEKPRIAIVVIITVLFGLFVAQVIAGIFSAEIGSDRVGLSSSKFCGIWEFDFKAGEEAGDRDDLDNYRKEARASQYARNCYNARDTASTLSCKVFYNQSIGYETHTNQRCPFKSWELCSEGLYSAVKFDTGFVDASTIGVNAPTTYKFRRVTTCSPLNMSEPYIQQTSSDEKENSFRYFYGAKENSEYTFNTAGHPFDWLVPAYSVNTYFSSFNPDEDYWHPIPELETGANSTITIMFISSSHIYYVHRTEDPIFNATTPHYFPGLREPFYYNSDGRARVLACVDQTYLCSPDASTCWSMTAPTPPAAAVDPAYWLMRLSLENSDIYDAIKWRLGNALLAQEHVSQFVSTSLSPHQWQKEASALFATSLATIQYDAWGIATGEDRDRPGYVEKTRDEARGRLCGQYKFQTEDYTNVNFAAFLGLPALALVVFVLSWDWDTLSYWRRCRCIQRRSHENESRPGSEILVIDVIARTLYSGVVWTAKGIYSGVKALCMNLAKLTRDMMRKREQRTSRGSES